MPCVIKTGGSVYTNGKSVVAPFDVVISCFDFCVSSMF